MTKNELLFSCLGVATNTMFLIAAVSFVGFSAFELNGKARTNFASVTYVISFIFFTLSGVLEFTTDVILTKQGKKRNHLHSRYTSKSKLNIIISVIFIVGAILDMTAFVLWQERTFALEKRVLFASAHTWLLSALLSIYGVVDEIDFLDTSDILVFAGNILFSIGSVIDVIVRYLDNYAPKAEDNIKKLEFSSSPFWLANALCFLLADITRSAHLRKQKKNREDAYRLEQVGHLTEKSEEDNNSTSTENEHKSKKINNKTDKEGKDTESQKKSKQVKEPEEESFNDNL
uniref:Uncharacterized protein n=1 Tax=Ditylum brightwellii TaxID=49249 RepID=A0A7S1Z2X3_9STRA|mmetsp:Transcript_231/g.356  ORF Transcript_231/g.356 Transcript_231/m.356 type:complete len:288 (+) Transcript_231:153-1016(+)